MLGIELGGHTSMLQWGKCRNTSSTPPAMTRKREAEEAAMQDGAIASQRASKEKGNQTTAKLEQFAHILSQAPTKGGHPGGDTTVSIPDRPFCREEEPGSNSSTGE